jgi:hypothetical protein
MNEELTWTEILKSAVALGLIDGSGSKAEAVEVREMLIKQVEADRVERLAFEFLGVEHNQQHLLSRQALANDGHYFSL